MKPKHSVNSTEIPPLLSGITTTDKYLAVLAAHEDWLRCIVDDYTFIDKPNKVSRKTTHGYIQRQLITDSKAEGEKFLEETEKIFADIVARFPGWQTPDPIIRYRPKQGMYYRQLRFTYDENEKFMQVIPEYLAIINADPSKLDFVFDKYAAAKAKCCKFEHTTPSASVIKNKKASTFEYDYDTAISKFIASLASPDAKKTANHILKRHFEQFYRELFPEWITEDITDTIDYYWVENNVFGGRTRETYYYTMDSHGECAANLTELAGIYYQRLCSELGVQPSETFILMFYPLLYNEIELLKLKFGVLSGTSTESEKIIQNFQQKIWKNGFDSVTLEQLDNIINDIQNGRLEYFNTGRNGENGSRTRSERLAIGAVVLCRAGKRVGCKALEYIASERSWRYKELIEQWARLKGFWFDENIYDILNRKGFKYLDPILHGRREAEVFTDGKIVVKIVSCKLYPCNIAAAIDRFIIHNQIFGERTALNIIGFGMIDNDFKIIAEQAYIHGYSADEEDTEKYLRSLFDKVTKDDSISYHTTDFIIGDLHQGNVLKSYDTGKVYVIDNFLKFNNNEFVDVSSLSGIDNPNAVKTDFDEVYAAICDFYGKGYSGTRVYPHTYYFDIKGKWNQFFKLIKTTPSYYILRSIRRFGGDFYYRNNDYGIAVDSATWENCFKHITAYPSPLFDNEILLLKQKYKTTKNR